MDNIAQQANHVADDFKAGMAHHDMGPTIDEINKIRGTMSPMDYGAFFTDLNQDLAPVLHGLTIDSTWAQDKMAPPGMVLVDGARNRTILGAGPDDEAILANGLKAAAKNTVKADGTKVYNESDGSTCEITEYQHGGGWVAKSTGSTPDDNFSIHTWPDGTQKTDYADGHGSFHMPLGNGNFIDHGWGAEPEQNYVVNGLEKEKSFAVPRCD